jgi:hypothetical protein
MPLIVPWVPVSMSCWQDVHAGHFERWHSGPRIITENNAAIKQELGTTAKDQYIIKKELLKTKSAKAVRECLENNVKEISLNV